jgi:hypothetical protein
MTERLKSFLSLDQWLPKMASASFISIVFVTGLYINQKLTDQVIRQMQKELNEFRSELLSHRTLLTSHDVNGTVASQRMKLEVDRIKQDYGSLSFRIQELNISMIRAADAIVRMENEFKKSKETGGRP